MSTAALGGLGALAGGLIGGIGSTMSAYGESGSWNQGGTYGTAAEAGEFNRQMMLAQQAFNASEAQKSREWSSAEAKALRSWQEELANTSFQRGVEDMQKAGINPIIAYAQGGAATPSGGMGTTSAASSGMASRGAEQFSAGESWGFNSASSYSGLAQLAHGISELLGENPGAASGGKVGGGKPIGALTATGEDVARAIAGRKGSAPTPRGKEALKAANAITSATKAATSARQAATEKMRKNLK